ncbi:MAG: hypothetical protein HYV07_24570 [Deltaproteobacteria bacterium]|nr:hypothetical protein [Deltaproteobacteria bacterium]
MRRHVAPLAILASLSCTEDPPEKPDAGELCPPSEDCSADGIECGPIMQGSKCIRHCGGCTAPETCGALEPNHCGCRARTCEDLGYECGTFLNICDQQSIECGQCPGDLVCGALGDEHSCGKVVQEGGECDEVQRVCADGLSCCGRYRRACRAIVAGACPDPLPDIVIDKHELDRTAFLTEQYFNLSDCVVDEGCAQSGARRLLKFATKALNVGEASLDIGDPYNPPMGMTPEDIGFVWHTCHMHYHWNGWIAYRLKDSAGQIVASTPKMSFGLEDVGRFDTASPIVSPTPVFLTSGNQGISIGWYDLYDADTFCQWVDVTDVPPGVYTLEAEVNPDRNFDESDLTNNVTTTTVTITPP